MARVTWRLIPFLCLLFLVNYLDRTNAAMAKLRMLGDTGLSSAAYGLGMGLFFIGYCLFEVPSNLILQRIGAKRWIARIMISWGLCSAAMMFTRGPLSLYAIRFFLGVAEAGFFPGIVFYLAHWVPQKRRARAMSLFLTSTATSGVVGTPLAGWLMKMDGLAGLHGWQWLFLLEGLPPVLLGLAILRMGLLPERPSDAHWLAPDERDWLTEELERDGSHEAVHHIRDLGAAAADGKLWVLCALYFLLIMGLYGFVYWAPTIVQDLTALSDAKVGMMTAIPYLVGAVTMVLIGRHADRTGRRKYHVSACALTGAIGLMVLAFASHHAILGMASLCVAAIGIFGTLGPFWAIPTRYLRGTAAAGGIAVINSSGAIAGFVAPSAIGFAVKQTGSTSPGLLLVAISLAAGAAVVLFVPMTIDSAN